jgi:hypothetical protein
MLLLHVPVTMPRPEPSNDGLLSNYLKGLAALPGNEWVSGIAQGRNVS